jgi:hypothetical protein
MLGVRSIQEGGSTVVSLAVYSDYRRIGRDLMTKVIDASLSRDALGRSAKMLNKAHRVHGMETRFE